MTSLVGLYVACQITVTLKHPTLKYVSQKLVASCLVVDDVFDKVGSPDWERSPIIVDCSSDKNFKMLKPEFNTGIYSFFKEDKDCDYEL